MIIIVVVVVLVINNVVLINAKIPSESMENTIMTGDRIFGYRLAYGLNMDVFGHEISKKWKDPERFDIVIFKYPDDESQLFIKRIIGLPGDKVEIKDGKVYINDSETPLDDSFVSETPLGSFGPYEVPENCYFMMGDNRNNSKDSRYWQNTYVQFDQIVGKAEGLALIQKIPTPITPVKMDKTSRHITLAYFEQKSTVDYIGAVQGIPVCFDAKECCVKTFPLANIHPHQVAFMDEFEKQKGISFFLIYFSADNVFYYLTLRKLKEFWKRMEDGGRKSFRREELDEEFYLSGKNGFLVPYLEGIQKDLQLRD